MTIRGFCPKCGRAPAVRGDGLLRLHRTLQGEYCEGSMNTPSGSMADIPDRSVSAHEPLDWPRTPSPELVAAASDWIWRHTSQPNGDRWRDDPEYLAWAAQNLLHDLSRWLD